MKRLTTILALVLCLCTNADNYLFRNGVSNYVIVADTTSNTTRATAARELQTYLKLVSGVNCNVTTEKATNNILLQETNDQRESYHYYTDGTNIIISGSKGRGLLYGVYAFLENEIGVHWFTPDYTTIPKLKRYKVHSMDIRSEAAFAYRFLYYYDAIHCNEWCAHNLLNTSDRTTSNKYGKMECWWGMHTFCKLIPADKYFKTHPEYFSLREGKRIENGQLCLSNPNVMKALTAALLNVIKTKPGYYVYDVSQNDNQMYCECDLCNALAEKYGGQSGLMVWFVNQVADEIAKYYPNVKIGTFAYRYTRSTPKNIKVSPNVAIRLCTFDCCFSHDLDACERNTDFVKDMDGWCKLTPNLHIYDYCAGFQQYIAPLPYYRPMAERLRHFHNIGVKTILELGEYDGRWGDMSEMKQWVAAKLMWNPYQDVDSLCQVFIDGYYGNASDDIWQFYQLTQNITTENTHFTIYCDYKNPAFTSEYRKQSRQLTDHALYLVKDDSIMEKRVNRVAALVYYLQVMNDPLSSKVNGTLKKLEDIERVDPTYFREHHQTLHDTMKHWGYI